MTANLNFDALKDLAGKGEIDTVLVPVRRIRTGLSWGQ